VPEPNDSPLLMPDEEPLGNDDAGDEPSAEADDEPLGDEEAADEAEDAAPMGPPAFNLLRQRQA
jgi:hypothetical protein